MGEGEHKKIWENLDICSTTRRENILAYSRQDGSAGDVPSFSACQYITVEGTRDAVTKLPCAPPTSASTVLINPGSGSPEPLDGRSWHEVGSRIKSIIPSVSFFRGLHTMRGGGSSERHDAQRNRSYKPSHKLQPFWTSVLQPIANATAQ